MNASLRGVNLAGAEWAYIAGHKPVEGQDFQFVSHQDIDYLAAKGVVFARLIFSWEILQPSLNAAFATAYAAALSDRVGYAASQGMSVLLEPHGGEYTRFARYKNHVVGSAAVPNSAFADLWRRLALQYQGNASVVFGLTNEPNNMSTLQWFAAAQAAIDAIRATGATNMIFAPGNGFSQPSSWNDAWYDTAMPQVSNAVGWASLHDPLNNTIVSVHTYFDQDAGGGADDIAAPDIIEQRMQPVVTWARARGLKVHLTEFGANAATPGAAEAVANAIAYLDANADVVIGWAWWAYGPPAWWAGYHFTLCPTNDYTVDDPKLAWLAPHFGGSSLSTIRPASVTRRAPSDSTFTSTKTVAAGDFANVPAGTYMLKVSTRTTFSDDETFCVTMTVENASDLVDVDWKEMTIDLRGHTLESCWNSANAGTTGIVTMTPTADASTVRALSRSSIGLCLRRNTQSKTKSYAQVTIKSLSW